MLELHGFYPIAPRLGWGWETNDQMERKPVFSSKLLQTLQVKFSAFLYIERLKNCSKSNAAVKKNMQELHIIT